MSDAELLLLGQINHLNDLTFIVGFLVGFIVSFSCFELLPFMLRVFRFFHHKKSVQLLAAQRAPRAGTSTKASEAASETSL